MDSFTRRLWLRLEHDPQEDRHDQLCRPHSARAEITAQELYWSAPWAVNLGGHRIVSAHSHRLRASLFTCDDIVGLIASVYDRPETQSFFRFRRRAVLRISGARGGGAHVRFCPTRLSSPTLQKVESAQGTVPQLFFPSISKTTCHF